MSEELAFDLDDLAVEVFDVSDDGLSIESLTDGHGMTELAASAQYGSTSCCSKPPTSS